MIVSDTNLIAHLWLPSENTNFAERVFKKEAVWNAPFLWKSEIRNVAIKYIYHKISTVPDTLLSIQYAEEHLSGNEFEVDSNIVIELARNSLCTSYDCEFVALAKDLEVPLLTFDKKILSEFPEMAIHPKDFVTEE